MSKRGWVVGMLVACGLAACGGGKSSNESTPSPRLVRDEPCTGPDRCEGTRRCVDAECEACECITQYEACTGSLGCEGQRRCDYGQCQDACVCNAPTEEWVRSGSEEAIGLEPAPDGSVLVRLAAEPWLVRYAADGVMIPLSLRAGLGWAKEVEVAPDSSVYVAGSVEPGNVRVEHLAPDGELLGAGEWAVGQEITTLEALDVAPDGTAYVLANNIYGRTLVQLDEDGAGTDSWQIPNGSTGPLSIPPLEYAEQLVFEMDGSFAVQGTGRNGHWLQKVVGLPDAASEAWVLSLSESAGPFIASGVVPDGSGGWFTAMSTGPTQTLFNDCKRKLHRVSSDGRVLWSRGDELKSQHAEGSWLARFARLDQTLVFVVGAASASNDQTSVLLDSANISANLVRYTASGELVQSLSLGNRLLDVASLGGESALVLSKGEPLDTTAPGYTVRRLDFAALPAAAVAQDGESCSGNEACASGKCCVGPSGGSGVCGSNGRCAQGDSCAAAEDCAGACVQSSTGTQGFCAQLCEASKECPKESFCVDGKCLAVCQTDCAYQGTSCQVLTNAEAIDVHVCSPE